MNTDTPPAHTLQYETKCPASWQIHSSGMVECRTCGAVLQAGGTPKCLNVVADRQKDNPANCP